MKRGEISDWKKFFSMRVPSTNPQNSKTPTKPTQSFLCCVTLLAKRMFTDDTSFPFLPKFDIRSRESQLLKLSLLLTACLLAYFLRGKIHVLLSEIIAISRSHHCWYLSIQLTVPRVGELISSTSPRPLNPSQPQISSPSWLRSPKPTQGIKNRSPLSRGWIGMTTKVRFVRNVDGKPKVLEGQLRPDLGLVCVLIC